MQVLELNVPVVVALNMVDIAQSRDIQIDVPKLAEGLGVPVVPTVARDEKGIDKLGVAIVSMLKQAAA